jgi:hypothetical protein
VEGQGEDEEKGEGEEEGEDEAEDEASERSGEGWWHAQAATSGMVHRERKG